MAEDNHTEDALYEHYRFKVDPKQTPIRIDKYLMDKIEKITRTRVQNGIRAGMVQVNDKNIKPNFKIKPGDLIVVSFTKPPKENQPVRPQEMPIDVRYEDDDLMIIYKPSGLAVHPGIGIFDGTLVNGLAYYFKNMDLPIMKGNLRDRPGLVHRLDKDTTGLMVIAKTEEAMTHLAKQFYNHTIYRRYQALVWGEPEEEEGTIIGHIGRHPKYRMVRHVFPEGDQGKHAVTHYTVLEGMYYVSLVECRLETGRTHQIRAHMRHKGHPLFADTRYGGDRIVKGTVFSKYRQFVENCFKLIQRQALHAKSLGFIHPRTGEEMFFDSDLPDDMETVLKKWRNYIHGRKELL